ncbi:unnamed protein product [Didymodactylos carnosus]|uniref:Uncharacterized protein n=1 Tax=Didymodactylos carnosus TaxID=1234261 RepID=A0A813NEH5_9BILA|nr:unnamed protein product [Didymodactylos carnosus]CAF0913787.1 unnamed protein product [Didymodactylos carnosus]CAF3516559.1 unnamed protein product [Didymodactylos carnosus]CAF3692466.1 unnamed protein product [Didymodactylos carnosus]
MTSFYIQPNRRLLTRSKEISSTFMQSRRFHWKQTSHDKRHMTPDHILSYTQYTMDNGRDDVYSQEACRLTPTVCGHDYQCCSGKCRCIKWSIVGTMSCLKKCF